MGRKAKRAKVLARIERLLGSETPAPQPSHISNSEMQERLKESKKEEKQVKKQVKKEIEEVLISEPTPVTSKEAVVKPEPKPAKAKTTPLSKKAKRKPRGSTKKS